MESIDQNEYTSRSEVYQDDCEGSRDDYMDDSPCVTTCCCCCSLGLGSIIAGVLFMVSSTLFNFLCFGFGVGHMPGKKASWALVVSFHLPANSKAVAAPRITKMTKSTRSSIVAAQCHSFWTKITKIFPSIRKFSARNFGSKNWPWESLRERIVQHHEKYSWYVVRLFCQVRLQKFASGKAQNKVAMGNHQNLKMSWDRPLFLSLPMEFRDHNYL